MAIQILDTYYSRGVPLASRAYMSVNGLRTAFCSFIGLIDIKWFELTPDILLHPNTLKNEATFED